MLEKFSKLSLAAVATFAFAGTALADHHEGGDADHGALDTHLGKLEIGLSVPISFNGGDPGEPNSIGISPDIWYNVDSKLKVGLVHSAFGTSNYWYGPATSLCVTGDGCFDDIYLNGGLRALYTFNQSDSMKLAADVGVNWARIDPFILSARLGIKGTYLLGSLVVGFNPAINIGITERDDVDFGAGITIPGNKEAIQVPVDVGYIVMPKLWAGVQSGINGRFDGFGDNYEIPLNIAAMYAVNPHLNAGVAFGFDNLIGKDGSADDRGISLMVNYNL